MIAAAVALAAVLVWVLLRDEATLPSPVRQADLEVFDLPAVPRSVTTTDDAIWIAFADQTLRKVDPADGTISARARLPFLPGQVIYAHDSIWVGAIQGEVIARVDPETAEIVEEVEIGTTPQSLTADEDTLFAAAFDEGLVRGVDPGSGEAGDTLFDSDDAFPSAITAAFGSLWVTDVVQDTVTRVDLASSESDQTIAVGDSPTDVLPGSGSIWVANFNERTVTQIDPRTDEPGPSIAVGAKPGPMATAAGFVWVLRPGSDSFVLIDPEAGRWTGDVYEVGDTPQDIAAGLGSVWIVAQDLTLTRVPID